MKSEKQKRKRRVSEKTRNKENAKQQQGNEKETERPL